MPFQLDIYRVFAQSVRSSAAAVRGFQVTPKSSGLFGAFSGLGFGWGGASERFKGSGLVFRACGSEQIRSRDRTVDCVPLHQPFGGLR